MKNNVNPEWNEDLTFSVTDPNALVTLFPNEGVFTGFKAGIASHIDISQYLYPSKILSLAILIKRIECLVYSNQAIGTTTMAYGYSVVLPYATSQIWKSLKQNTTQRNKPNSTTPITSSANAFIDTYRDTSTNKQEMEGTRSLLRLQEVFDHDTFTLDDRMGDAEFEIQPFVEAVKMRLEGIPSGTILRIVEPTRTNCLAEGSRIIYLDGKEAFDRDSIKDDRMGDAEFEIQPLAQSAEMTRSESISSLPGGTILRIRLAVLQEKDFCCREYSSALRAETIKIYCCKLGFTAIIDVDRWKEEKMSEGSYNCPNLASSDHQLTEDVRGSPEINLSPYVCAANML
ncbi:hypothetical protein ACLOJK_000558 [Asimina triloba]